MYQRKIGVIILIGCLVFGIGRLTIISFINYDQQNEENRKVAGRIDGNPIYAPQLTKSNSEWRNGYGTKSDGQDTNSENQPTRKLTKNAKSLIIYFSRSGSTELLASKIAKETNADILEIIVKNPYAGNYQKTLSRANSERESQNYPKIDMNVPDLSQYQTVYLGYPIWAMTLSHPMTAFLTEYGNQLSDKKIAPFMTEGGYGQGDSVDRIKEILRQQGAKQDTFTNALVVDGNKVDHADSRVMQWVKQVTN
ncbi:flavodoxin family protein [Pediococcus ethanolidurans]|uniref:Flavodoxin n=1 Tax=Pediococcus ethanolidurans TaxID=319653 RepID=A0A0R2K207_9LACO|nr:flavodoxin [Pediococcus ethanolidurans]KRN83419.1 flavodoxin [Pediococcus ethanolidurans]GEN94479.1 flavodoxin [Pediococcus ethanolidurans]SER23626.1 Flavodoxin [Pediococcus ethanolidurans]